MPYKDLIETYAEEFNSHSLPCTRSEGIDVNATDAPVVHPLLGDLAEMDMDDHKKNKAQKKREKQEKKEKKEKKEIEKVEEKLQNKVARADHSSATEE